MIETKYDLWGDIDQLTQSLSPDDILKEQAKLLKQKTEGRICVDIHINKFELEGELTINFYFKIPKLNNYIYDFLYVSRPLYAHYPARIFWNEQMFTVQSENEFIQRLEAIFVDKFTRKMIQKYNRKEVV